MEEEENEGGEEVEVKGDSQEQLVRKVYFV